MYSENDVFFQEFVKFSPERTVHEGDSGIHRRGATPLKLHLGHEDSEEIEGEEWEEEEDPRNQAAEVDIRPRATSLKLPGQCRRGPRKHVTFADYLGLDLIDVRSELHRRGEKTPSPMRNSPTSRTPPRNADPFVFIRTLVPVSRMPVKSVNLYDEFRSNPENPIILEDVLANDLSIKGVVLIKNWEYKKCVTVRYTLDKWKTWRDHPCEHHQNLNNGLWDRFGFNFFLPYYFEEGSHVEFAPWISFGGSAKSFWDNNHCHNYSFQCVQKIQHLDEWLQTKI